MPHEMPTSELRKPKVGDPPPGGMYIGGQFCPPGLFQFVGYGEAGTLMEGCEIYEPRLIEMVHGPTAFKTLLERIEPQEPKVDWLA
jgi:hypothetical protein